MQYKKFIIAFLAFTPIIKVTIYFHMPFPSHMPVVFKYFATIQFGTKTSHFLCMNCLESLENNSSDFKSYKLSQETD